MKIEYLNDFKLNDYDIIKFKKCGNIYQLSYSDKRNYDCKIKKIDKDNYINLDTGELKQFVHYENRADDKTYLRKTFSNLRDLLNTNITDVKKCRWITLTYRENMQDTKKLYSDYKIFNILLRRKIGAYEYIAVAEPQGRGAWHLHIVMIFEKTAPYIDQKWLENDIWKNGSVKVKKLDDVDNVGAYLTAYLGDLDIDECNNQNISIKGLEIKEIDVIDDKGQELKKRYVKGARLSLYPPKFNLYRISRGIKKPQVEILPEIEAKKKISSAKLTFEKTFKITDEVTGFSNIISHRYYNTNKK